MMNKKDKKKKVSFAKSVKLKLMILSVLSVLLALVPIGVYIINAYGTDIYKFVEEVDVHLLVCVGVSILILLMMGYLISNSITDALRTLTRVADKSSRLDFSENKDKEKLAKKKDEIGYVNKAISDLESEFSDIISKVRNQKENVSKTKEQLQQAFSDMTTDVENMRETVRTISEENSQQLEYTGKTARCLDCIGDAAEAETEVLGILKESAGRMTELVSKSEDTWTEITKINEKTAGTLNMVTEQAGAKYKSESAINDIVTELLRMVEEITLLSLNASSEAARAGSCGRDFGLVASQIRSVSEEATGKVNDIEEILSELMYHSEDRIAKLQGLGAASQLLTDRLERAGETVGDLTEELGIVPFRLKELSEQVEVLGELKEKASGILNQMDGAVSNSESLRETLEEQIDTITEDIDIGKEGVEVLESWCKELDHQTNRL